MADAPKSSSIREKFGTDYLIDDSRSGASEPPPTSSPADAAIERAVAAFGTRILVTLRDGPQNMGSMHDLVDRTGLRMETLSGVVDRMVRTELVRIAQQDKYGNHILQITPTGEDLLKQQLL